MGHTVSFVEYSSTISIDDWAKDLNIVKTFDLDKEEEEILGGKIQEGEKKTLVLMSDGWVVDQ